MRTQRPIPPLFAITTPIRYINRPGGGTGFFFSNDDKTWIITNRHVLNPPKEDPEIAKVWVRDRDNLNSLNPIQISLKGGEGKDLHGHPRGESIDLALIPLNKKLSTLDDVSEQNHKTGSLSLTPEYFIHKNIQVDQRVVILGYPGSFIDKTTLFPVRRNALISTPYGYLFNGNPFFVTDARMHPGTSGSPVLMEAGGMMRTTGEVPSNRSKGVYLLGIHSATFYSAASPQANEDDQLWEESKRNSKGKVSYDLNVAWYPELINDILDHI